MPHEIIIIEYSSGDMIMINILLVLNLILSFSYTLTNMQQLSENQYTVLCLSRLLGLLLFWQRSTKDEINVPIALSAFRDGLAAQII